MARPNVRVSFKTKDRGWERIKRELTKLGEAPHVKVGVQGKSALSKKTFTAETLTTTTKSGKEKKRAVKASSTTLTVVEVALWNEFGTERAPERSFIRSTFDEKLSAWRRELRELTVKLIIGGHGLTVEKVLRLMGEMIQRDIQRKFVENDWEKNSPETIARKGSSRPLIDTAQLRRSITYVVVLKGTGGREIGDQTTDSDSVVARDSGATGEEG